MQRAEWPEQTRQVKEIVTQMEHSNRYPANSGSALLGMLPAPTVADPLKLRMCHDLGDRSSEL
jgi:hypothetical protein